MTYKFWNYIARSAIVCDEVGGLEEPAETYSRTNHMYARRCWYKLIAILKSNVSCILLEIRDSIFRIILKGCLSRLMWVRIGLIGVLRKGVKSTV